MGELGLDVLPMCPRRSGFFDEWDPDKCGYIEYEELYTMQNDIRKSVVLVVGPKRALSRKVFSL